MTGQAVDVLGPVAGDQEREGRREIEAVRDGLWNSAALCPATSTLAFVARPYRSAKTSTSIRGKAPRQWSITA
jgi:hypothetical protein